MPTGCGNIGQSDRESLEQQLFSEAPIYDDLETAKLADSLSMFMERAGADNEWVRKTLQGKSPQARADELVRGTRLKDVAFARSWPKVAGRRSKARTIR